MIPFTKYPNYNEWFRMLKFPKQLTQKPKILIKTKYERNKLIVHYHFFDLPIAHVDISCNVWRDGPLDLQTSRGTKSNRMLVYAVSCL